MVLRKGPIFETEALSTVAGQETAWKALPSGKTERHYPFTPTSDHGVNLAVWRQRKPYLVRGISIKTLKAHESGGIAGDAAPLRACELGVSEARRSEVSSTSSD